MLAVENGKIRQNEKKIIPNLELLYFVLSHIHTHTHTHTHTKLRSHYEYNPESCFFEKGIIFY